MIVPTVSNSDVIRQDNRVGLGNITQVYFSLEQAIIPRRGGI